MAKDENTNAIIPCKVGKVELDLLPRFKEEGREINTNTNTNTNTKTGTAGPPGVC